jgi:hypothetical protein
MKTYEAASFLSVALRIPTSAVWRRWTRIIALWKSLVWSARSATYRSGRPPLPQAMRSAASRLACVRGRHAAREDWQGFGRRRRRRVGPGPKGDAPTFRIHSSIHPSVIGTPRTRRELRATERCLAQFQDLGQAYDDHGVVRASPAMANQTKRPTYGVSRRRVLSVAADIKRVQESGGSRGGPRQMRVSQTRPSEPRPPVG